MHDQAPSHHIGGTAAHGQRGGLELEAGHALGVGFQAGQIAHMLLAAFASVGFAVAAVHTWLLLKDPDSLFHRRTYAIAFCVGGAAVHQDGNGLGLGLVRRHVVFEHGDNKCVINGFAI